MSNRERVRQLQSARDNACGIGTRLLKLRLNKLAKLDPVALAVRLALEIEDANLSAKRYRGSKYQDRNYAKKEALILELITLFRHQEWLFGLQKSDGWATRHVIYFDIPKCEQISWHYTHRGAELPTYPHDWDGKVNSTLIKLFDFVVREYPHLLV